MSQPSAEPDPTLPEQPLPEQPLPEQPLPEQPLPEQPLLEQTLPEQTRDDLDVGWGDRPEGPDDERFLAERPPHWE